MDRQIVYIGSIPLDTILLLTNRNAMISDGGVAQGILGTSTLFSGLAVTPTSPATMTVNVAPGFVFSQQNVDNSAYGSLSADTTQQIMKIGLSLNTQNFSCPAPATSGQSVVYLVEAAFLEQDTGPVVLPYYNAANPSSPWNGPNNTGVSQNTVRQDICNVQVKVGVPAATGTQVPPTPDAGYTGLFTVTVANGQTTITSGNISVAAGAPFISETLTQKISQATADTRYAQITTVQNGGYDFGIDTSGTPNTLTVNITPNPTAYVQGMTLVVTVANANSGPSTINVNGLGAKNITYKGNALTGGELLAGQNAQLSYNGSTFNLISVASTTTSLYSGTASTTGTANAQILTTVTPSGFTLAYGNIVTFTAGNTNTGATTINVQSTGAITIKKKNTSGALVDLAAGDLTATDIYQIIYDGTFWELNSQSFPAPSTFFQTANNLSEGSLSAKQANLGIDPTSFFSTGDTKPTFKNTADTGWIMANDGTIGSAASSATYANANAQALYVLLWTNISNTYAPVTGGRGGSALADFNANKPLQLPLMLGRTIAISGSGSGLSVRSLGQNVGDENLQTHTHTLNESGHFHAGSTLAAASDPGPPFDAAATHSTANATNNGPAFGSNTSTDTRTTGITVNNAGTGSGGNMQPTMFMNIMIKL